MKIILYIFSAVIILFTVSCDKEDALFESDLIEELSDAEIIEGLKEALKVATDTSVSVVSVIDGYYGDQVIKILLPSEADVVIENIALVPGGQDLLDNVIKGINRSAEDAALGAAPIFVNAITSMTISDAYNILHGEDTSATHYLKINTYTNLTDLFKPIMQESLNKSLVAGVSTQDIWSELTTAYNTVAGNSFGLIKSVDIELDDYVTDKALVGLFVKIADEEKEIRNNPLDRVTDILKKVFGSLT